MTITGHRREGQNRAGASARTAGSRREERLEGKSYTAHSQIAAKATNAKMHGAKAVLLVNDLAVHPTDSDQLDKFGSTVGPANAGIEFAQVTVEVANGGWRWPARIWRRSKRYRQNAASRVVRPPGFARSGSHVDVRREVKTVHNVGLSSRRYGRVHRNRRAL